MKKGLHNKDLSGIASEWTSEIGRYDKKYVFGRLGLPGIGLPEGTMIDDRDSLDA